MVEEDLQRCPGGAETGSLWVEVRRAEAAGRVRGRWAATELGTSREAGLTEESGGREQSNGARVGPRRAEGTLLPWPLQVMELQRRRGQAVLRAPTCDLPYA